MFFELKEGEEVLADMGAVLNPLSGGRMKITNQRILFESDAIQSARIAEIPLGHIADVRKRNVLGIALRILIRTKAGVEYKFWVWYKKQLADLIQSHLPKP